MKPALSKLLVIHLLLYTVGFAVLGRLLPWALFVPVAMLVTLVHLYLMEWAKRKRYKSAIGWAMEQGIDGFPNLPQIGSRAMDDLVLEALKEMGAELEKKCYQMVEKNIQLLSLKDISATIISSLDESRIVHSVQTFLGSGLGFKEVFVGIFTPDTDELCIHTLREAFAAESIGRKHVVRLANLKGLIHKTVTSRRSVLIRDAGLHPIGDVNGEALFAESTMSSYLLVPMLESRLSRECRTNSECLMKGPPSGSTETTHAEPGFCAACGRLPVLGVIGVTDGFKAAAVSPIDLVAVESLAQQVSTLLENSRLYNELKKEESFRENVINSMMNGLITVDTDGSILLANQAAERISGFDADELTGIQIGRLISDRFGGVDSSPFERTISERKKEVQKEAWLIKKDGKKLPIVLSTSLLLDEDKRVQGVLGMFLDITRIKRMEKTIQQLDKLAALGRFSSAMAHEIRNPLGGVVAGIEYLKRARAIPADQKDNITFILSEVNRIDRLITDILNVVRTGDLVYQPVELESLINTCIVGIKDVAKKNRVRITHLFPDESQSAMIDADRITQVMLNLLKNAVEASDPGGEVRVTVSFSREDSHVLFDDTENLVIIEIKDDGTGFSEDEKSRIFEPFFTTKKEGTGLGLYVTHNIVERHGGYIFVDSQKGRGSVFTVYLPLEKVEHGEPTEVSHPLGG